MSVNSFANYPLSWKPTLRGGGDVKYLELARLLEDDILAGRLAPGVRLPPQRELADYLGLHFTTITRAYDVCRAKGLIYGIVGRGTFVASEVAAATRHVVELGVVQAFPCVGAGEVVAAARRVLARGDAGRLFDYTARDGRSRAREAALRWFAGAGICVPPERVAIFPGTQSALSVALLALFQPGDRIAVDAFTYANLIELAYLAHLKLVAIPSDRGGMRPDALRQAGAKERLKGLFVMPTAANPTGLTLSIRRRRELAAVCAELDLIVLEDDAALEPAARRRPGFVTLCPDRTVHLAGATRLLATGLRVAFVVFPERFRSKLLKGLHHLVIKASALEAEILAELILSGAIDRLLASKRACLRAANAVFDTVFGQKGDGFFRTLPLPGTAGRGAAIEAALLARGLRVCHSDRFAVGRPTSAFLRLSVSSEEDPDRLRTGLKNLKIQLAEGLGEAIPQ